MIAKKLLGLMSLIAISLNVFSQGLGAPVSLSSNSGSTSGQADRWGRPAPDSRGYTDPAIAHNKLLVNDGVYQLVGQFKVKGSSYLLGQKISANVFSQSEKAWNIFVSYNTYNQEVEFYSTSNPAVPLVKEAGTLDSFVIAPDVKAERFMPWKFIYSTHLGETDKAYYLEIFSGANYSLYKRYKAQLDYDNSNLGQSELRIFEITFEYFYSKPGTKGLKKLKPGVSNLIKEFKDVKDLNTVVDKTVFSANPEVEMRKAFRELNN